MRKILAKAFYYLTFKKLGLSYEGYWLVVVLKTKAIYSPRDVRKTILKDTFAVRSRSHIHGLRFGGRVWR